jgi:hyperosmotically inducible protein
MPSTSTITRNIALAAIFSIGMLGGCSSSPTKSPDVETGIRHSLDQSGYKDVSVSQDRDKGVITLTGHVPADSDKQQAESIANSLAAGQVVSDQIAVLPPGGEKDAEAINSDLDKGIEKNVDAALIQNRAKKDVSYDVKNGVVTLKGSVNSQIRRTQVERIASGVPNVKQVVNELQVRDQKASSTN